MGLTIASAQEQRMHDTKGVNREQVKVCLQQRKGSGLFDKNLSRAQRLAIRLQYRACIHQAVMLNYGHASSQSSQHSFAQPSITLLSPNGGETLTSGRTYRVGWATANIPRGDVRVRVDLYPVHSDTGLSGDETGLVGFVDADQQAIMWTVPRSLTAGAYTMTIFVADFSVHSEGLIIAKDSSDSYFKIVDATPLVSEQVKCIFNNATTEQQCYSSDGQYKFSGIGTAGGVVTGPNGTALTWKSSCGGYAYTTLDGNSEYAHFSCSETAQPSVTILSPNGGETYKNDGSPITVHWQTNDVSSSHAFDVLRLRAYPDGPEYNLAYTVINDGQEIVIPSSVPVGAYTLEIKTYVNGNLVMDASDSYFKIIDATSPHISEQVKCVFHSATTQQECYTATADGSLSFSCSSIGTCVADVKGPKGTALTWKSSCGGYAYTTLDGNNESANFFCGENTVPRK